MRQPPPRVLADAADEVVQTVLTLRLKKGRNDVAGIQRALTDFKHTASGRIFTNPDGNVTLGFHEGCHRELLLNDFRHTALPVFDGAVGDLISDFEARVAAHIKALEACFEQARTDNVAAVDEAEGSDPTMSTCLQEE